VKEKVTEIRAEKAHKNLCVSFRLLFMQV
jgi:hypothetical protein